MAHRDTIIHYASDLHLEFGRGNLKVPGGDVLLLAGDICLPWGSLKMDSNLAKRSRKFFQECCSKYGQVFMVLGNHEHYHGTYSRTISRLEHMFRRWKCHNIRILENETVEFGNYVMFAATFWTDVYGGDPLISLVVEGEMNDYRLIRDDDERPILSRLTRSENAYTRHQLQLFFKTLPEGKQPIVMTHHAPFFMSVPDRFRADDCSFGYANTKLEYEIDPYDIPPTFWIHGHTHDKFHYSFGNIQVMCNPRGYITHGREKEMAMNYKFGLLPETVSVEVLK